MFRQSLTLLAAGALLAACGNTTEDRAGSGAGIGAAAGAVIGAVTGVSVLHGALIGAGVGGVTGAVTDSSQVNLGKPIWRSGESKPQTAAAGDDALVRSIQGGLQRKGFDPGPVDGRVGPKTRAAITAYQQSHSLPVDGLPSAALRDHLEKSG